MRKRGGPPEILYVEVAFTDGKRLRMDPLTKRAQYVVDVGGLLHVTESVPLVDFIAKLQTQLDARSST